MSSNSPPPLPVEYSEAELKEVTDIQRKELEQLKASVVVLHDSIEELQRQRARERYRLRVLSFRFKVRRFFDDNNLRIVVWLVAPIYSTFGAATIGWLKGGTASVVIVSGVIGFLLCVGLVHSLFLNSTKALETAATSSARRVARCNKRIGMLYRQNQTLASRIRVLTDAHNEFSQRLARVRISSSKLSEAESIYSLNWREMRGIDFEQFLSLVFRNLGYEVEETRETGDQGVDLIVRSSAFRVAVQAKGYEKSVGNSAVQQVVAGMSHYRCDGCVAITNSTFTTSARELARSNNCTLIDGDDLRDLIFGRVPQFPRR